MDKNLTTFLLRTLCPRPKGLRLRLKIHTVNKHLECFTEQKHLAATIMSHGLFLAQSTPERVKYPALIGVLNQHLLKDRSPDNTLSVCLRSEKPKQVQRVVEERVPAEEEEMCESSLGKRVVKHEPELHAQKTSFWRKNRVSVFKDGIQKNFPASDVFDADLSIHLRDNSKASLIANFTALTIPDVTSLSGYRTIWQEIADRPVSELEIKTSQLSAKRFIASIQSLVDSHKLGMKSSRLRNSEAPQLHKPKARNPKSPNELQLAATELKLNLDSFSYINDSLEELRLSLAYFKNFLLPNNPKDLEIYHLHVKNCQTEFQLLVAAFSELLIEPFCDALSRISTIGPQKDFRWDSSSCEGLRVLRDNLQKLTLLAVTPIEALTANHFELSKTEDEDQEDLVSCRLLEAISHCLDAHSDIRRSFIRQLEIKLGGFPSDLRYPEEADLLKQFDPCVSKSDELGLQDIKIVENYTRISDSFLEIFTEHKFCVIQNAKGDGFSYFAPTPHPGHKSQLEAIVTCRGTQVCFSLETRSQNKGFLGDSDENDGSNTDADEEFMLVKLIRGGKPVGSFILEDYYRIGREDSDYSTIQYFTGRYFVYFDPMLGCEKKTLFVLDLWPCNDRIPQHPILHEQHITNNGLDDFETAPFVYSCTDEFLSYFSAKRKDIDEEGFLQGRPKYLRIIKFDPILGFVNLPPIPCSEEFKKVFAAVGQDKFSQEKAESTQMCWTTNLKHLFYINWNFDGASQHEKTFAFVCFCVSGNFASLQTVASRCFALNLLPKENVSSKLRPRFSTLHTKTKDYLVLDLLEAEFWERRTSTCNGDDDTPGAETRLVSRAMFAVHRGNFHWVTVDGRLFGRLPEHIGPQLTCAGYDVAGCSLFHAQRVFSHDKVVYRVCRLQYMPA